MQLIDAIQAIPLVVFQSGSVLALLLLAVGVVKPGWILFWMDHPKPFYLFIAGVVLFILSFTGLGLKVGDAPIEALLKAMVIVSILILIVGLINPAWVFGTEKADRFWVLTAFALLFMGFMTLLGPYLKARSEAGQSNFNVTQEPPVSEPGQPPAGDSIPGS